MFSTILLPPTPMSEEEEEATKRLYQGYRDVIETLPKARGWGPEHLRLYKGYWLHPGFGLEGVMWSHDHFKPRPSDALLVTNPKCGTTWLKSLAFSILSRSRFDHLDHPLLTTNPHKLVPFLEFNLCRAPPITDPESLPSPRLLSTHAPLSLLPDSVLTSGCRIVYLCRDPKDMFVSRYWYGLNFTSQPLPLEEEYEAFCEGASPYGPFWNHVLEFWKTANSDPDKVLFLRYEDLKSDPLRYTKELASFLGQPFSPEEEEKGEVRKIVELCSFEKMSNLEVNKTGLNSWYYRRGEVGDWKNHLTIDMKNRLQMICQEKFAPFQLKLGYD